MVGAQVKPLYPMHLVLSRRGEGPSRVVAFELNPKGARLRQGQRPPPCKQIHSVSGVCQATMLAAMGSIGDAAKRLWPRARACAATALLTLLLCGGPRAAMISLAQSPKDWARLLLYSSGVASGVGGTSRKSWRVLSMRLCTVYSLTRT